MRWRLWVKAERAKDWMKRALLIEPDNMKARYNFACSLAPI